MKFQYKCYGVETFIYTQLNLHRFTKFQNTLFTLPARLSTFVTNMAAGSHRVNSRLVYSCPPQGDPGGCLPLGDLWGMPPEPAPLGDGGALGDVLAGCRPELPPHSSGERGGRGVSPW